MKIGILGTGNVGKALGTGLIKLGHEVKIGSRNADKPELTEWVNASGSHASRGTFAEAAAFGEVIFLATLWTGTENVIKLAGPDNFKGKILVDTTNPLDFSTGAPKLSVGYTDSAGEQVQRWLPEAKVVKAFNIVGAPYMVQPPFSEGQPDMFIGGNDEGAKKWVTDLLTSFGWPTIDLGGIDASRLLESLAMVWITYGFRTNTWFHALKLLRK